LGANPVPLGTDLLLLGLLPFELLLPLLLLLLPLLLPLLPLLLLLLLPLLLLLLLLLLLPLLEPGPVDQGLPPLAACTAKNVAIHEQKKP
jgi:hypothetical protein